MFVSRARPPIRTLITLGAATSHATETVAAARTHHYDGSARTSSLPMLLSIVTVVVVAVDYVRQHDPRVAVDHHRRRRLLLPEIPVFAAGPLVAALSPLAATLSVFDDCRHHRRQHLPQQQQQLSQQRLRR